MIITIDTEKLSSYKVTPNEYVYLAKLSSMPGLLSGVGIHEASIGVMKKEMLIIDDGCAHITEKGKKMLEDCNVKVEYESAPLVTTKIPNEIISLTNKFRDMFPVGVRSGGYLVRSTHNSCLAKMKSFKKKYPEFDDKTILKATHGYINRKTREGYAHMKLAPYFIEKDGVSMLAAECEALLDNSSVEQDDWGKDV